jgi:hypothetical protein
MRKLFLLAVLLLAGCGTTDSNLANQPGVEPTSPSALQQFVSDSESGLKLIFNEFIGPRS